MKWKSRTFLGMCLESNQQDGLMAKDKPRRLVFPGYALSLGARFLNFFDFLIYAVLLAD